MNGDIHFSFLTGVTKFSKVSIFSDLNNLDDVSFDREYSSLCGITEKELRDNFKSEVQSLANEENTSYDDVLDILRAKYDGYRFSKKEERIYNPFSLLNALSNSQDKLFLREHNYQTAIYLIFCLMGQYMRTEVHSSSGCSDAEVETKDAIYIFEFKVGGEPIDAITQIKKSGYAEKYGMSCKSIFLIGATIGKEGRTLDAWEIEMSVRG